MLEQTWPRIFFLIINGPAPGSFGPVIWSNHLHTKLVCQLHMSLPHCVSLCMVVISLNSPISPKYVKISYIVSEKYDFFYQYLRMFEKILKNPSFKCSERQNVLNEDSSSIFIDLLCHMLYLVNSRYGVTI